MNKKILVVIVLLLITAGAYFGYTKFMAGKVPGGSTESASGAKSLKDLLSSGVAQKCTYSTTDESGTSEGTTYVSGGKVRADFTTVMSGKTTKSHMITDNKTSYVWTDGEKNGFKTTISEEDAKADTSVSSDAEFSQSGASLNEKVDYKCSGWVVDGSFFTPPSNVTFTDFSQLFAPTPAPAQGAGSSSSSQCSYCDSLAGEDKTQCLAALNCN